MINVKDFNSLFELLDAFPTEESCIQYLEDLRWKEGVISPFDSDSKVWKCKGNRYFCKNTRKFFNIKTGTIFDNTKLSMRKWFMAIWLILSHKKGISSMQLARDIKVTQKTAWFMLQRIRVCLAAQNEGELENKVEADETFVGGKNKNRHHDKKVKNSQGRSFKDKTPVLGILQRNGKLIAKVVCDTKGATINPIIRKYVKSGSVLYSDEWWAYRKLNDVYEHHYINHGKGQYGFGEIHTNTIEGFWSLLKRGYIGIYHYMSPKHLQQYVNEFIFRYNTRKFSESSRFNLFLCNSEYKITYSKLTA